MTTMPRVRDNETGELVDEPSPASPAVCIAEAAKEAIDMALATDDWRERDHRHPVLRHSAGPFHPRGKRLGCSGRAYPGAGRHSHR
jgi:hypothetical protein